MSNKQNQFESRNTPKHRMNDMNIGLNDSDPIIKEAKEKGVSNHRLKALDAVLNNK